MKTNTKILFKLIILFFCIQVNASAQITFQKTYGTSGNEEGISIHQTTDMGYIISGLAADGLLYTIKTNSNGDTIWTKKYFAANAAANAQTIDGGYIIAGYTADQVLSCNDFRLIKTNPNGIITWTSIFVGSSDVMNISVVQTNDGGYLLAGTTDSINGSSVIGYKMMIIKTDANGVYQWSKRYGTGVGITLDEEVEVIQQTSDGGYILLGRKYNTVAGDWNAYLVKTDSVGSVVWSNTYGGAASDVGNAVQQTSDGGYIIAGTSTSFGAGDPDMYLIKTDAAGALLWSKTFGGTGNDAASGVKQTSDGGYLVIGQTTSFGAGNYDVFTVKTDAQGTLLWSKTYGGSGDDRGYGVAVTQDGGAAITGYTASFGAGAYDFYFIKTDSLGNSFCNEASAASITNSPATVITSITTSQLNWGGAGNDIPFVFYPANPFVITNTSCLSVGIDNSFENENHFTIAPNPFSSQATISFSEMGVHQFKIMDVLGLEICSVSFTGKQYVIEKGGMNRGVYFVQTMDENKNIITKKIIIQ